MKKGYEFFKLNMESKRAIAQSILIAWAIFVCTMFVWAYNLITFVEKTL